jgi:hypothetical protein
MRPASRLSEAEIDKAGIDTAWEILDADYRDYEPQDDDDAAFGYWREDTDEQQDRHSTAAQPRRPRQDRSPTAS